ncbi:MAG: hypothetical protein HKN45_10960 [Flavobacteriales bacterium]|nr:hypothetical protein [Flavobacteriales bacterium]
MSEATELRKSERGNPIWSSSLEKIILSFVLLCSLSLSIWTIDSGHAWGGDFALYIEQAIALNNGTVHELYEVNKYSMDNSPSGFGPYLYPMGYPMLLAPLINIMGYDLEAMKYLSSLLLIMGLFFLWRLIRSKFLHPLPSLLIVGVVGLNYNYTLFCDNALSDIPFFGFVMLTLYVIEKAKGSMAMIALGSLLFFTYFIRDIGLFLLPALAAWQWMQNKRSGKKPDWLNLSIPYLIFISFFFFAKALLPPGTENHLNELFGNEANKLIDNTSYYTGMIDKFFLLKEYDVESAGVKLLRILFVLFMAIGMIKKGKESLHYLVFSLLSITLYLLWPYNQGIRFLFPVIPFLILFTFQGLTTLTNRVNVKNLNLYIIGILCVITVYRSVRFSYFQAPKTRDMVERKEITEAFLFINENISEDAVIGFHKPRVLRLYTGRNGVYHPFIKMSKVNADYLLVLKSPERFPLEVIFENEAFLLYRQ